MEIERTMPAGSAEKLDGFFAAVHAAPHSILLLDYDGSMAPFRVDRFQARPYAGVRQLLERIRRGWRTQMVVVTGRPAGEIAPLLGLSPPLEVWGLHGAERLFADGRRELEQPSETAKQNLDELRELLGRNAFGGRFEDKANGVVMHWRGVPRQKARAIELKTRRLFEPLTQLDGLRLLDFESGVELRRGRDKGGAVKAILEECREQTGVNAPVAYIGDDITDEAAFRAVNEAGAPSLSVLMRHDWRETEADIWLRPPRGLLGFLRQWAEAIER